MKRVLPPPMTLLVEWVVDQGSGTSVKSKTVDVIWMEWTVCEYTGVMTVEYQTPDLERSYVACSEGHNRVTVLQKSLDV